MFCYKCGKKAEGAKKFCVGCGAAFSDNQNENTQTSTHNKHYSYTPYKERKVSFIKGILTVLVVGSIAIISIWNYIYNTLESDALDANDQALEAFESGDSSQAIKELQKATESANFDTNKIETLKNLAYVYASEGNYELALSNFKNALSLTDDYSFNYFLISGEINELEGNYSVAALNYNKAYELEPNDFQINNSLALFHLDLDERNPRFVDYKKALNYAKKAHDVEDSLVTRENLGIAYYYNDNYDQAIFYFLKSNLTEQPYMALWLGYSYAAKEDVVNAEFYFRKAINLGVEIPQEVYDYLNS